MRRNAIKIALGRRFLNNFSINVEPPLDYDLIAKSINEEVNRSFSLWGRRDPKCVESKTFRDKNLFQLAAKHLGFSESDDLLRLSPQGKSGKLPNVMSQTRIVYEEGFTRDLDRKDNDIWLGCCRYCSYFSIGLKNTLKNLFPVEFLSNFDGCNRLLTEYPSDCEECDYTIFVYPYMRKNSKDMIDIIHSHAAVLNLLDLQSLIYMSASTGSSRLLRFLGAILSENCTGVNLTSAIHSVEGHAWPWMNNESLGTRKIGKITLPLLLDALCASAVIRYTFDNESTIFEHIHSKLKLMDQKAQELSKVQNSQMESTEESGGMAKAENIRIEENIKMDKIVLEKIVIMLILKRNFDQLNNDHIRVFSDFVCDRLHRIDSKSIANISFGIGHSKHLDEFWMFMMAKHIQENISDFGPDELTAILDAYSTASLEDFNFYNVACESIMRNVKEYSTQHLAVILRSLAKVRVRNSELLNHSMERLQTFAKSLQRSDKRANLGDKANAYVIATGIVSAGDLDYKGRDTDEIWRALTQSVKDSSFDICAISWIPLAAITFASFVTLRIFLPVWIRHVRYTIQKLRSRTFMMTIQRRHALLRHAFNLGILPVDIFPKKTLKLLEEICEKNYIVCREDYIPESSTFHLEVCACLRALEVQHQREINIVPFVMDIVIPPNRGKHIKSPKVSEAQRISDEARCGHLSGEENDLGGFGLKYTRHSPNHRKRKEEIYIYRK